MSSWSGTPSRFTPSSSAVRPHRSSDSVKTSFARLKARAFKRAKLVFTESDERCGLTAELDGVKREGVPLQLDIDQLEDAKTSAGARAQLKEALRLYFRRVLGK